MHPIVAILLYAAALYAAAGIVTAVAFAAFGVARAQPAAMSLGARILIVPGAAVLWPYVLASWAAVVLRQRLSPEAKKWILARLRGRR